MTQLSLDCVPIQSPLPDNLTPRSVIGSVISLLIFFEETANVTFQRDSTPERSRESIVPETSSRPSSADSLQSIGSKLGSAPLASIDRSTRNSHDFDDSDTSPVKPDAKHSSSRNGFDDKKNDKKQNDKERSGSSKIGSSRLHSAVASSADFGSPDPK